LVIQADDSRKQSDNVQSCFVKLHELVVQAGREVVPGETSAEQMKHVEKL
jgi:peptidyl-tRNA hydrolase ICT1